MSQGLEDVVKVLFVDDEPNILSSLRRGLIEEQYVKFFANSGDEALQILSAHEINVIVTDMKMPVMNGLDLLKIVTEKYPDVVKIVLSGYNQLPQVLATINTIDVYKYIVKPWDMDLEFIPVLRGAIEQYQMKKTYRQFNQVLEKKNEFYQKMIKVNDERFLKLKTEVFEANAYSVDAMKHYHDLVKQLLSGSDLEDEFERLSKLYVKVFSTFYGKVPTETSSYPIDKMLAGTENIMNAWYELVSSKFKQEVPRPIIKLGDVESLKYDTLLSTKDFEHYIKLIIFDIGLLHLKSDQHPFCEIHGFYHSEVSKMVLDLQIHELQNPFAIHMRDQLVHCYSKIFELLEGEFVHYHKLNKEHFILTLPVVK